MLFLLRKRLTPRPGLLFAGFLIFAGVERFLIEGIRVTSASSALGLTQAQIISIGMILGGMGLIIYKFKSNLFSYTSSMKDGDN